MKDASSLAHALHPAKAPSEASDLDIEVAFRTILGWLGEDPARDGLRDTPSRLRRAFKEYFSGYREDPDRILRNSLRRVDDHHEAITLRGIAFHSHCEHHVAPIVGRAWITYAPNRCVVEDSVVLRVVEVYSRRLQIQERLTAEVASTIDAVLQPKGVGVVIKASHFCMIGRGVRTDGTQLVTSKLLGCFRDNVIARREFLAFVHQ
jgi:GTP cyclohydrolase IA